jgi:site-specific DNA-cytosine methylase
METVAVTASAGTVKLGGSGKVKWRYRPPTVVAGHDAAPGQRDTGPIISIERACELQGLPDNFTADMPFTVQGKRQVLGNGVPLPMGRAIARAVRKAIAP